MQKNDRNVTFDEYKREVIRQFYKISGLTEKDGEAYLNGTEAESKIKSSYKYYMEGKHGGYEPPAVASCLDMMYE